MWTTCVPAALSASTGGLTLWSVSVLIRGSLGWWEVLRTTEDAWVVTGICNPH